MRVKKLLQKTPTTQLVSIQKENVTLFEGYPENCDVDGIIELIYTAFGYLIIGI